jgi:hypothetical protein
MTGTVEKIEFTRNGFGNQFTTIDVHRYWWNFELLPGMRTGARVRYDIELNKVVWDLPHVRGDVAKIHQGMPEPTSAPMP